MLLCEISNTSVWATYWATSWENLAISVKAPQLQESWTVEEEVLELHFMKTSNIYQEVKCND